MKNKPKTLNRVTTKPQAAPSTITKTANNIYIYTVTKVFDLFPINKLTKFDAF